MLRNELDTLNCYDAYMAFDLQYHERKEDRYIIYPKLCRGFMFCHFCSTGVGWISIVIIHIRQD